MVRLELKNLIFTLPIDKLSNGRLVVTQGKTIDMYLAKKNDIPFYNLFNDVIISTTSYAFQYQ